MLKSKAEAKDMWPGAGDPPKRLSSRVIHIVFQLSQEGQRQAFLTVDNDIDPGCDDDDIVDRVQQRQLAYTDDDYRDALKMAWFSPAGHAVVFIGGRDTFAQSKNESERLVHHWVEVDGLVPGPWCVESQWCSMSYTSYSLKQTEVPPLMIDDPTMPTGDLLDLEQVRQYEIRHSKTEADKELAALYKGNL